MNRYEIATGKFLGIEPEVLMSGWVIRGTIDGKIVMVHDRLPPDTIMRGAKIDENLANAMLVSPDVWETLKELPLDAAGIWPKITDEENLERVQKDMHDLFKVVMD